MPRDHSGTAEVTRDRATRTSRADTHVRHEPLLQPSTIIDCVVLMTVREHGRTNRNVKQDLAEAGDDIEQVEESTVDGGNPARTTCQRSGVVPMHLAPPTTTRTFPSLSSRISVSIV